MTEIRITDLADPEPNELQQAGVAYAAGLDLDFSVDGVLAVASDDTGLEHIGSTDVLDRLAVWLEAVEADEGLNPLGRLIVHRDVTRRLGNRMRLARLLDEHPEIHDEVIDRPIIVAGLPRSGTTHLVNLMAADRRLRSLPYWESLEPFPRPEEVGVEPDPRIGRCLKGSEAQDALAPHLRAMHHMTPEHVHEEIEVQELDVASYILEWNAVVPGWRDHYLSLDLRPSYEFLRTVLKALQWLRGPRRWVLKSPQHLEQLGPLLHAFPDATVAITHRDPVAVIQSAVTMLAYGDRIRRTHVDPPAVAAYWIDRVETMLRACVRDRELVPAEQSIDVLFHEFMADDVAMVERIYDVAGLPMTSEARADLDAHMAANPRGKHGRVVYDLEADFGVDPDEARSRFDFYFDRFPIMPELARRE